MAHALNFTVDDTSPSIFYFPFPDTLGIANLSGGWNPSFQDSGFETTGGIGSGDSYHVTSHNAATLSITWRGTGIELLGYTNGGAGYEIALDGATQRLQPPSKKKNMLAALYDLNDTIHKVSLTTIIPPNKRDAQVYFNEASIIFDAPANITSPPKSLDDPSVSFHGQWTFSKELHCTNNTGDSVQATINGTSFLLRGQTSPSAGTYSVILDGVPTANLSGTSSFTNPDTLLFFATGLDPDVQHDVKVVNEGGGSLFIKVGGFQSFMAGPLKPVPTKQLSGATAAHAKGTIAALVLAGILGFLVISGSLFFFLVVRPRKRRVRQARLERARRKEREVGAVGVFNIAPAVSFDEVELGSIEATPGHHKKRSSGRSGFARWKREVEGGFGNLGLNITFRHSGSTGKKSTRQDDGENQPLSAKSSMFTLSSRGKGKKKAKPKLSESSWSPNFALELAVRPESIADSLKDKEEEGPSHIQHESDHSITSHLTSLSYMNTPPAAKLAPPSYSITSSNGHTSSNSVSPPLSIPRSVSRSTPPSNPHSRSGSAGLLLSYEEPSIITSGGVDSPQIHVPLASSIPPPMQPSLLSALLPRDRGSAQYSSDDATSDLGPAATRLAIRALSPRTSEFPELQPSNDRSDQGNTMNLPTTPHASDNPPGIIKHPLRGVERAAPLGSETSFLHVLSPENQPLDIAPEPKERITPQVDNDDVSLDVGSTSQFAVDFMEHESRKQRARGQTTSTGERKIGRRSPEDNSGPRKLRSVFRLTPPSNPPTSAGHSHMRSQSASFLDFSGSSDTSHRTQSVAPSELSSQNRQRQPKSRWSSTMSHTTDITRSGSSGISIPVNSPESGPNSYFPYPVSLPPSPHHPEGHTTSQVSQSGAETSQRVDRYPARVLRLSAFGSPTDSVPVSVTDTRLRRSISTVDSQSESAPNSLQLPPHPPLPELPVPEIPPPKEQSS